MKYRSDEDGFARVANDSSTITIDYVSKWVKTMGKRISRVAWFEARVQDSVFFTKIAKPLMSRRTTHSMIVERVPKSLKNIFSLKGCKRLWASKGKYFYAAA